MPLPVIENTVRCAVSGTVAGGGRWTNVWHWRYGAAIPTDPTVVLDGLHSHLLRVYHGTIYTGGTAWLTYGATGTTVDEIVYTVLNGTALAYGKPVTGATAVGNPALPAQTAFCLTLRTALRGRRYRGRIYLPAIVANGTNLTATGLLQASVVTGCLTQVNGAISAAGALNWKPVVASYGKSLIKDPNDKYDKIEVSWTPFATDVITVTMDTKADVQRGRK